MRPQLEQTIACVKDRTVLNAACRANSGCLRPTRVADLYLLCGIAPLPLISDGQPHPSLKNTNKKTTLCIIFMSKIQPERYSNQGTASSTLLNPLMAAAHSKTNPLAQPYPGNTTRALHQR